MASQLVVMAVPERLPHRCTNANLVVVVVFDDHAGEDDA